MSKPIIGAQLFTARETCKTIPDIVETFKTVKASGYTQIQVSAFGPVDPKELGQVIRDSGLKVAITHMGWDRFRNNLDDVISDHKEWGCTHTAIGGVPGDYFSADGAKKLVEELKPITERLAAEGLDFSYHNHSAEMARCGDKVWMQHLLDESVAAGVPVNAEIDTYWIAAGGGDPAQWLRKWAGKCPCIHLKDMSFTVEKEQRTEVIGLGNLNWPEILKAAEEAGVESALVEQDRTYGRDPLECLDESYRFLSGMGYK